MPGMNGVELVEAVRSQQIKTAIIMITAYGCKNLQPDCVRLRIYHCLDKPIRIENIRQVVRDALRSDPYANRNNGLKPYHQGWTS